MTTSLKILLAASVTLFFVGLTDTGSAVAWGVLKPLGAVLFIVFFIGQLLHKEVVKYDEEYRARLARAKAPSASPSVTRPPRSTAPQSRTPAPLVAVH